MLDVCSVLTIPFQPSNYLLFIQSSNTRLLKWIELNRIEISFGMFTNEHIGYVESWAARFDPHTNPHWLLSMWIWNIFAVAKIMRGKKRRRYYLHWCCCCCSQPHHLNKIWHPQNRKCCGLVSSKPQAKTCCAHGKVVNSLHLSTDWLCTKRFCLRIHDYFLFHYQKVYNVHYIAIAIAIRKVLYGFWSRFCLPCSLSHSLPHGASSCQGKYFSTFLIIVRISSQPNKN